jgi:hypothetical protein
MFPHKANATLIWVAYSLLIHPVQAQTAHGKDQRAYYRSERCSGSIGNRLFDECRWCPAPRLASSQKSHVESGHSLRVLQSICRSAGALRSD